MMEIHPFANIFPDMSEREFSALRDDIKDHGQREPILTYQGKIVDGRHRFKACRELGIEPTTCECHENGSIVSLVVSLNLHRRHLTTSQVNAIGADVEELYQKEAKERQRAAGGDRINENSSHKGRPRKELTSRPVVANSPQVMPKAREQAAKAVGGSARRISDAKMIKKAAPKLHEEVKAGKKTLNQALREVNRTEKTAAMEVKAKEAEAAVFGAGPKKDLGWEIITGDCIEVMKSVEFVPIDLAFADPPYNIGIGYGHHYDDARPRDEYLIWCREWMSLLLARLLPHGSFFLLANWEGVHRLAMIAEDIGFNHRQTIVWYETFGVNCGRKYNRCSRGLIWFTKHREKFTWNPEAVNRPSDRQTKYKDKRADPEGKVWDDVWGINPDPIPRLVDNHRERIPGFPTQLPLDLLRPIVAAHSDPGHLVVDPFSGSGTTGAACVELGRRFVGIELSEEFAGLSRKRLLIKSQEAERATSIVL
jgi:DNA modification methylase/ParB-like chromosome segregation protein Spo0J